MRFTSCPDLGLDCIGAHMEENFLGNVPMAITGSTMQGISTKNLRKGQSRCVSLGRSDSVGSLWISRSDMGSDGLCTQAHPIQPSLGASRRSK
jgi:hypothetical protein